MSTCKANPGRVTYPCFPDFHGTTFIKQLLLNLNANRVAMYQPATPDAVAKATAPLWRYLDALHHHLWRQGKQFARNAAAVRQMMAEGELMLGITFNPNEAANKIAPNRPACALCSQSPTRSSGDHGPNVARTPRQLGRPH